MNEQTETVGLALYHATDLAEQPELVHELLEAANVAMGGQALSYVSGQFAGSDRFSRQQKVDAKVLTQLKTDLRGRIFRSLQFDALSKAEQKRRSGYTSLHIDLHPARSPSVSSTEVARFPYRVYMLMAREQSVTPEQIRSGLGRFLLALPAPYAFVTPGYDYRDVLMELVSTPVFPWGRELSAIEKRRHARLCRCQTERARLGELACGPYWGNLLGKKMIDDLGGSERVKREAPVAVVEDLPNDSLYLQLTPDLPNLADHGYQHALAQLEAFLRPISV
jgi:hypothetical protein